MGEIQAGSKEVIKAQGTTYWKRAPQKVGIQNVEFVNSMNLCCFA